MALGTSLIFLCTWVAPARPQDPGLHEAVFSEYSPLSSNVELARRLLTPLTAAQLPQLLARAGRELSAQPINLSEERFLVYVPPQRPVTGYALFVFVPPWSVATLPQGWASVLDQYGAIFVSAARSGNDASTMGRREPLALSAAHNILRHYSVDSERVYVGGFSGGARVAMRLALGYPDVFHGALLNAGSDAIGSADVPLPPTELFLRFQNATRLVYLTGYRDTALAIDLASIRSMHAWCVFDVDSEVTPWTGHEVATAAALSRGLQALFHPGAPQPSKLTECRARIQQKLDVEFGQVEALIASGKADSAQKLLRQIDARFGGLAAPHSLELAARR